MSYNINDLKLIQPLVDVGIFYAANEVVGMKASEAKVDMSDMVIYGISSLAGNNSKMINRLPNFTLTNKNAAIALNYAIVGTVYDLITTKNKASTVLKKKFIQSLVGFGSNSIADILMRKSNYTAELT